MQQLVYYKVSRKRINNRGKRTVIVHFFLLFFHIFLHNVPFKNNYSLLSSARKRDQFKRDDTGYMRRLKKTFYV